MRLSDMVIYTPSSHGVSSLGTKIITFIGHGELTAVIASPCIVHNISITGASTVTINIDDSLIETITFARSDKTFLIGLSRDASEVDQIFFCDSKYNDRKAVYNFYVKSSISCYANGPENIYIKYVVTK